LKTIVVDASVAIKWFIPEIYDTDALHLFKKKLRFIAPDLIFAEVTNILWKKNRLKELSLEAATNILNDFKKMPIDSYESEFLLDTAWQIATAYQCTVYDSLYVALAKTKECIFVTADKTLYNNLHKTTLAHSLLWIENIKNI